MKRSALISLQLALVFPSSFQGKRSIVEVKIEQMIT